MTKKTKNENKKYILLPEGQGGTPPVKGLRRVKALKDLSEVKKGALGGWVAGEKNLSAEGNCWIYGEAVVSGSAYVKGDAVVKGNARVEGEARIMGSATVGGSAKIKGEVVVSDIAHVEGKGVVSGEAIIRGVSRVFGDNYSVRDADLVDAQIGDDADIDNNAVTVSCSVLPDKYSDLDGWQGGIRTIYRAKNAQGSFEWRIAGYDKSEFLDSHLRRYEDRKDAYSYQMLLTVAEIARRVPLNEAPQPSPVKKPKEKTKAVETPKEVPVETKKPKAKKPEAKPATPKKAPAKKTEVKATPAPEQPKTRKKQKC
jgi:cell division septation protein DedD